MLPQNIIDLYDEYTHKPLTRNEFINRLISILGSSALAMTIIPMLESKYSEVKEVDLNDLKTEYITYPGVRGEMRAYIVRPDNDVKLPAVIVIYENRGLTKHIEDVARRVARMGYLAVAPDALSPLGMFEDEDEARKRFGELKNEDNLQNFIKGLDYTKNRADYNGNLGCVGFCWGGAMSNNLAIADKDLKVAVAFYGRQPNLEDVSKIKGKLVLHYAELDERVNAGISDFETKLKTDNIDYQLYMYPGVQHAFHNDTSAARYNQEAANLAWDRTIKAFDTYLK
jgi:carboxymethylenebutenolidase